jgi:hypothetical protein
MRRVVAHLLKLPAPIDGLRTACGPLEMAAYRDSFPARHMLTGDVQEVSCVHCLSALGIAPAGARLVDADGREVAV